MNLSFTRENGIFLVSGLLIGGGVTFLTMHKVVEAKYAKIANDEIESVKRRYAVIRKVETDWDIDVEDEAAEKPPTEVEEYQQVITELDYSSDDGEVRTTIVETPDVTVEETEVTVRNIFKEKPVTSLGERKTPYPLTDEEYAADEAGFEHITLRYFVGDTTLVDDQEEIIPDVDRVVGIENLEHFGEFSGDPNVLYIRNERLQTDFEVIIDEGEYVAIILGVPQMPQERDNHVDRDS